MEGAMMAEPESLSDTLRQLSTALRDGFDQAMQEARQARSEHTSATDEVAELRKTIDELIEERDAYEAECNRLQQSLGRIPDQLSVAQQTCRDLSGALRVLTKQRDQLMQQRDTTLADAMQLRQQLGDEMRQVKHLRHERDENARLVYEARREVDEARAEIERWKDRLQSSIEGNDEHARDDAEAARMALLALRTRIVEALNG